MNKVNKVKRIAAIVGLVLFVSIFVTLLISSFFATKESPGLFLASLFSALVIPIMIYMFIAVYKMVHKNDENADISEASEPEDDNESDITDAPVSKDPESSSADTADSKNHESSSADTTDSKDYENGTTDTIGSKDHESGGSDDTVLPEDDGKSTGPETVDIAGENIAQAADEGLQPDDHNECDDSDEKTYEKLQPKGEKSE